MSERSEIAKHLRGLAGTGDDEAARMQARLAARMFGETPPPSRVGRFELHELLGAGAMGVVYAARDPELDRMVALKLLRELPGRASDPERHRRLQREAKAMARLRHPNVVQVHEVGTHEGQIFVAMERIAGGSLREWMDARERGWAEVVEVFVAAGRGLAAAHSAGLIHRDFKPDNVLIETTSGRVFVGDFGLARPLALTDRGQHDTAEELPEDELGDTLTQTGACVGTPAYMAPEASAGAPVEAAADQFSFCAALYEALYGVRPFAGATLTDLTLAKARRQLAAPPPGRAGVPRWLRRIVVRGLAPDPKDRFASMQALLDTIRKARARRRRGAWIGATGSLAVAVTAGVVASLPTPQPAAAPLVCRDGEPLIAEVWAPDRRDRIDAAFQATDLPYADAAAGRIDAELDRYAQRWAQMHREACEATHVHGEQSSRVLDLRMRCLDRRREQLDALLRRFELPTEADVRGAVRAVASLTPISACAEVERLESAAPLPDDPQVRELAVELRHELDVIEVAMDTGAHADLGEQIEPILARAEKLGYKPILADAQLIYGLVESRSGRPKQAGPLIEKAIVNAQASGHDELAARAMITAVYVLGYQLRDIEGGERYLRHARAMLERLGQPPALEAQLLRNSGTFEFARGNFELAEADFRASLAIYIEERGADDFTVAEALTNVAAVLRRQGRTAEALATYADALELMRASLGPEHPNLFQVLNNMAVAYMIDGQDEAAEQALRDALAILELGPPDLSSLGHVNNNLGELYLDAGRWKESIVHYDRATASWTEAYDAAHPLVGHALAGRGLAHLALAEFDLARADLEHALEIRTTKQAPASQLADAEFGLARALYEAPDATRSDRDRALALARDALVHLDGEDTEVTEHAQVRAWLADK